MPEDLDTEDEQPEADSPVINTLRKERDTAKREAEAALQELEIHRAGLTGLSQMQMKALKGAHEGAWDADSLKATADELGFGQRAEAAPEAPEPHSDQLDPQEAAIMRQMQQASGGRQPVVQDQEQAFNTALKEAKSEGEVIAALEKFGSPYAP